MAILPAAGLVILILQCFDTVNAGKVKVNNNPQVRVTTSFTNWDARIMDQWSSGGGKGAQWTIGNDSYHPFVGRNFGGASRDQIKGTGAYGSGYTYEVPDGNTTSGRDFPFGSWPIYWGNNFMGSDEYGPQNDGARPGGQLVIIPVKAQPNHYTNNLTDNDMYYVIGDRDSALGIMVSFVTWCYAEPAWPSKFQPTSPNSTVKIENVITYYRASSFALASPNYNNSFAHTPGTNDTTSIPDSIQVSQFWPCLDGVISNALMIMNQPPPRPTPLGVTLGIIFGVLGLPILVALVWFGCIIVAWGENIKRRVDAGKERKRAEAERRKADLAYENYP